MEWIASIQKAINYIEEHLLEEINYEDVANHVCISSYEFHRAFGFVMGMTPIAYIRNRRLSLAAKEVISNDIKIIDIALKYGYDTSESFSKAFTRFHGVSPKSARENMSKLVLFNPLSIKLTIEGGLMNYKITEMNSMKFLTICKNFKNEIVNDPNNHDIPDFWDECYKNGSIDKLLSLRPGENQVLYGLCNPCKKDDTFDYSIGVILDENTALLSNDEINKLGLSVLEVPSSKYVVLECFGEDASCSKEMRTKFYKEFLPQMGCFAAHSVDFEVYYGSDRPGLFCELWIPICKK
jgi:AraC family transcriptional regulator